MSKEIFQPPVYTSVEVSNKNIHEGDGRVLDSWSRLVYAKKCGQQAYAVITTTHVFFYLKKVLSSYMRLKGQEGRIYMTESKNSQIFLDLFIILTPPLYPLMAPVCL